MAAPTDNEMATRSAGTPVTLRVFFALWPDAAARDRIAATARDVVRRAGGRAPRPENHHMTLAFVGDVAPARIPALESIGDVAARAVEPFALTLDRVGEFHHTGIAWLGCGEAPDELEWLVDALRGALAVGAFPVEGRRFRAHLTLARRCGTVAVATIAPVAWRVESITLAASETRPAGALYRELTRRPLGTSN